MVKLGFGKMVRARLLNSLFELFCFLLDQLWFPNQLPIEPYL
jgi:hypothetical protein